MIQQELLERVEATERERVKTQTQEERKKTKRKKKKKIIIGVKNSFGETSTYRIGKNHMSILIINNSESGN